MKYRNRKVRLTARQNAYDAMVAKRVELRAAFRRPGSLKK